MLVHDNVLLEKKEKVATVTICRPEVMNALNADVFKGLIKVFESIEADNELRLVIIRGQGEKAFVAGADILAFLEMGELAVAEFIGLGNRTLNLIESCCYPVIAVIEGFALGGGLELALACDMIVSSATGKFGFPEVKIGIHPGLGGTQRLRLKAGIGITKRMVLTGELINAEEAKACGIVEFLFSEDNFNKSLEELINSFKNVAPLAVREARKIISFTEELALKGGITREIEGFLQIFKTSDRYEGMKAFIEKRPPKFTGK
jgi:enoyl-CoA hydratase